MTNMTPLTDDQRELAERYVKLAMWMARKVSWRYPRFWDEIESAAMFGLVSAARSFDPSRGTDFSTLARMRISGAIADATRETDLKRFIRRRDHGDCPRIIPFDRVMDFPAEASPNDLDESDSFERLIRPLPENIRHVCRRRYLHGESQCRIAASLGVSQTEISRRLRLAVTMLRHELVA